MLELHEDEYRFCEVADRGRADHDVLQGAPALGHEREAAFSLLAQGTQQRVAGFRIGVEGFRRARLRETARVFLAADGSFTAAAEQLTLHKNTVHYRVRKAEEILGRPLQESRLDVELALAACRWLGPAVLRPPPG